MLLTQNYIKINQVNLNKPDSTRTLSCRYLIGWALVILITFSLPLSTGWASTAIKMRSNESQDATVVLRKLAHYLARGYKKKTPGWLFQRFAVLRFTEGGAKAKENELGLFVASQLITHLKSDQNFNLVERQQLKEVFSEVELGQMTGNISSDMTQKLLSNCDAQALIMGSVVHSGGKYIVNSRIVSVKGALTVVAKTATLPDQQILSLAADSLVLKSREGALFRSLAVPGWGQIYNRQTIKGFSILGAVSASLAGGAAFHLLGKNAEEKYQQNLFDTVKYHDTAENHYWRRNIFLYLGAGLWLYNIVDAYVNGHEYEGPVAINQVEEENLNRVEVTPPLLLTWRWK